MSKTIDGELKEQIAFLLEVRPQDIQPGSLVQQCIDEAKQVIRVAIEQAEPEFRTLQDDDVEKYYNGGYNHALSDYRIALLQELGLDDSVK